MSVPKIALCAPRGAAQHPAALSLLLVLLVAASLGVPDSGVPDSEREYHQRRRIEAVYNILYKQCTCMDVYTPLVTTSLSSTVPRVICTCPKLVRQGRIVPHSEAPFGKTWRRSHSRRSQTVSVEGTAALRHCTVTGLGARTSQRPGVFAALGTSHACGVLVTPIMPSEMARAAPRLGCQGGWQTQTTFSSTIGLFLLVVVVQWYFSSCLPQ